MKYLYTIFIFTFFVNCSSKITPQTSIKNDNLEFSKEDIDLATFRSKYEFKKNDPTSEQVTSKSYIEKTLKINKRLDSFLDSLTAKNKSNRYTNGFRVQLYVGNDKKAAEDAKIYSYQTFPDLDPYLSYTQPVYKVKIGDFLTRFDAEKILSQVKEIYPQAIILPDKIEVKKGLQLK